MSFHAKKQTVALTAVSQVPIILLLVIFFRIPMLPTMYRIAAVVTVMLEAALMSELIGNIVQKVRTNEQGVILREVMERHRIVWQDIKGLKQMIVSPLRSGIATRQPTKLFLIKTKEENKRLKPATDWWNRHGPVSRGRTSLANLTEEYDEWVRKHLAGWRILWKVEYKHPQVSGQDVEMTYTSWDGREKNIVDDLNRHFKKGVEFADNTYPTFIAKHGGKYADDVEHVWETLE